MIEQISLLTVDLIGHISCLLLCTALFRRTCAKRQLVLAFLGTLAAGYLITVVPVIREFPIKAILLVMVFTVFCHACYEGKILTQCLCAVFSYVIYAGPGYGSHLSVLQLGGDAARADIC